MSKNTKKRMTSKHREDKNNVYWSELDKHKKLILNSITDQASFLSEYLEDPQIAKIVDNDKESTIIINGFCKDINHISTRLKEISDEHKDKKGKIVNHEDYVKMVQLFEEYNETALKFDHSLQTAVTEINTKIALEASRQAKESGNMELHDEIVNSGIIENTENVEHKEEKGE